MWRSQRFGTSTVSLHLVLSILACVAIAIGVYSRFVSIAEVGMWNEELHSMRLSDPIQPIPQLIEARVAQEGPPLYQLFLFAIRKLAASSEWQIRFAQNALFVGAVFSLWTRLNPVPGWQTRLIQSAFLVGSYGMIYFSSELRSYVLIISLAIPQSLLLLRILFALEKSPEIPHRWMTAFAVVSGALSLVHYVAAVAVGTSFALLATVMLVAGRARGLSTVVAYGFATCLPVVAWFLASYDSSAFDIRHVLSDPVFMARQIDRFLRLLGGSIIAALCLSLLIAIAALTAVQVLMRQGLEAPIELKAAQWLGAFVLATWVIAYAITIVVVPIANMKTLLVTAPTIYLALGCVIAFWLNTNEKIARAGIAVTLVYFLLSGVSTLLVFERNLLNLRQKKDWVTSAELINDLEECAGEPIVVVANLIEFYRYYIDRSRSIELIPIGTAPVTVRPGDAHMEERVELQESEVAQARELTRSSRCSVKMWYVPTAGVSEKQALDLGARILGAGNFRLERVGNAMLFRSYLR